MADGKRASDDDFSIIGSGENDGVGSGASLANGSDKSSVGGFGAAVDPAQARGNAASGEYSGRTNKDGSPAKKRGRKSGQGSQKADNSAHISQAELADTLTTFIKNIHQILAKRIPEMELRDDEARDVAGEIIRLKKYLPAIDKVISGPVMDITTTATVITSVYGMRIAAIKVRNMNERAAKDSVDITPNVAPGPGNPNYNR